MTRNLNGSESSRHYVIAFVIRCGRTSTICSLYQDTVWLNHKWIVSFRFLRNAHDFEILVVIKFLKLPNRSTTFIPSLIYGDGVFRIPHLPSSVCIAFRAVPFSLLYKMVLSLYLWVGLCHYHTILMTFPLAIHSIEPAVIRMGKIIDLEISTTSTVTHVRPWSLFVPPSLL